MNLRPLWGERRRAGVVGASLAILLGLILNFSRLGYGLAHLSYDLPSALAPESNPSEAAIVQVDEELVQTSKPGPGQLLDRAALAHLVDRLREDQCRLVVLDIIFDLEGSKEADQQLAASIKAHGNVVLAAAQEEKQRSFPETGIHVIQTRPRLPREEFLAAAKDNWGFCDVSLDTDSTVRRHYPGTDLYPSLPWKAACLAGAPVCKEDSARWAPRWLRYYGPPGTLETLSYPEAFRKQKRYFSGKTVFVGKNLTTPFIDEGPDEFRTPYTRWNGRYMSGAEILATTFLNLLRGDWLTRVPPVAEAVLLLLFGAGFGFGLVLCRPAAATGYAFAGILGLALMAWLLFCKCHVWFPWAVVAGGQIPCALLWAVISQSKGIAQEKERLQVEAKRLSREKRKLEKAIAKQAVPESGALPISSVEGVGKESVKDFELVKPVGKGAYGEVWLARNAVGMYQAVKLVYRDKLGSPESYEREFNGIRNFMPISLNQAGLLRVLHVGRSDREGFYYCVMELGDDEVSGREIDAANYSPRNLGKDLKRRGRIPLAECVDLGLSLSSTLEYLHSQQLVHRDIKPSNIIFVNGVPKLADIGLVTEMDRADMSIVGTPGFMEKSLHGTRAGDLASLGKVLYVCCSGCAPEEFPHLPASLVSELNSESLLAFKVVIARACGHGPHQPYESAAEMHSDLERLQRELSRKMSVV
jgi:CHASE2 domain-containing sensor protein